MVIRGPIMPMRFCQLKAGRAYFNKAGVIYICTDIEKVPPLGKGTNRACFVTFAFGSSEVFDRVVLTALEINRLGQGWRRLSDEKAVTILGDILGILAYAQKKALHAKRKQKFVKVWMSSISECVKKVMEDFKPE